LLPLNAGTAAAQEEETPVTKWMSAEKKMIDSLPKQNQEVYLVMRNKENVIHSIDIVHRDVGNAVKACSQENPDLAGEMTERFEDWEEVVIPILNEAEKYLAAELKEQEAFHVGDYKYVSDLNEKAFKYRDSQIVKEPVTSESACRKLLRSMDATEEQLVDLMQEILLPEDVIRMRVERTRKAS
jgi:hypothetical protein